MQTHTSKVMINSLVMIVAVAFLLNSANAVFAQGSSFVAYSAAGADATVIQPVVNAFRNTVGSPNNGNAPGRFLAVVARSTGTVAVQQLLRHRLRSPVPS